MATAEATAESAIACGRRGGARGEPDGAQTPRLVSKGSHITQTLEPWEGGGGGGGGTKTFLPQFEWQGQENGHLIDSIGCGGPIVGVS